MFVGMKLVPTASQRVTTMHQQIDLVSSLHKKFKVFLEISTCWRRLVDWCHCNAGIPPTPLDAGCLGGNNFLAMYWQKRAGGTRCCAWKVLK